MKVHLPPAIETGEVLRESVAELRHYHQTIARGSHPRALSDEAKACLNLLPLSKQLQASSVEKLTQALDKLIKDRSSIHITLAAEPSDDIRQELTAWIRAELSPSIFVYYEVQSYILGGMIVRTLNHMYDWSYRTQLEQNTSAMQRMLTHA